MIGRCGSAMRHSMILRALLLAALLAPLGAALDGSAVAVEEKLTAREQVGKPVQAAEQLLKQKRYKEAQAKLQEADAVPAKTPYETYVIEATRAVLALETGDYPGTIKALDAVLATGILPPSEALKRVETLVQLSYQAKTYPGVIAYGERYYKEGGSEDGPRQLMAQAYYLEGDFTDAARTSRVLMQQDQRAGRKTGETLLQLLVSSEYKQKNDAGYRDALKRLVASYPKKEYWRDLLATVQKQPGFADRLTLDLDRLMAATDTLETQDQYMEAAQLALQAGLPGDAKALLNKGYAAGVLGKGAGAERQQRLAAMAAKQSGEDLKTLPQLAYEADAARDGLPWVKLGEADASYRRYDDAIAAYQKGLQKGGLKHPEDTQLHLGVACLHAGQKDKALAALGAVTGTDGAHDLAQLWLLAGSPHE
jgi:tetratricopeptide (TPR) repeat protein